MIALAGILLLGALAVGGRSLWVGWPGVAAVLAVLAVRLWGIPALARHEYDGHEADHLALFLGEAARQSADTLRYPLMQEWWSLWGALLPGDPRLPVVISAAVASLGAAALAGGIGALGGRRAGWAALVVIGLHPSHAAWSSSAYNVALPGALAGLAVLGVAMDRIQPSRWWPRILTAAALALASNGRMEVAVVALPCGLLALSGPESLREALRRWLPVLIGGLLLAGPGLLEVFGAGPLPGAEERAQSWRINIGLLAYHAPYHQLPGLLMLVIGGAAAGLRWPKETLTLASVVVIDHGVMASFDDYSARHTLPALVGIAWLLGAGAAALPRWAGGVLMAGVVGLSGAGLVDLSQRYYGSEEAFAALLEEAPWAGLPRWEAPPQEDCGWVAEDPRVAGEAVRSHFNLLSPTESGELRGADGCLRWCLDAQDWRWSSRGVRNRAIRLELLFSLQPEAVVLERSSGYACLVMRIGERSTGASPLMGSHGRGHPADTRIP